MGQIETMDTGILIKVIGHVQQLLACALCGGALYMVYRRTSPNTMAEAEFASTVMVLAVATTFIVSVIKDSFAISIGLIGVLSIVRFRTSIQSPRQLLYIFVAVAIGVANGAGEFMLAALGTGSISFLLYRFPIMPFDLERPTEGPETARIVAKISTNGGQSFDIRDVSVYLAQQNLPHMIKEARRSKDRAAMTIHFYDSLISEVDKALLTLQGTPKLADVDLEFELRNKLPADSTAAA